MLALLDACVGLALAIALRTIGVESNMQSKTPQTPPVTSSSIYHVIYPIPQKIFFNALAFILLHLTMAHGMSNILYPFFNQQGTWHPVSQMLYATCLQLYPHTSLC
jgi:hypothetical protein